MMRRSDWLIAVFAAVLFDPLSAVAQLAPVGQPIEVASGLDEPAQSAVAMDASGSFVVVWTAQEAADPVQRDVRARHFDRTGEATGEAFPAAQTLAGSQESPAALALRDGGWVLAWYQDYRILFPGAAAAQRLDLSARLLDAAGVPAGDEFLLNETGSHGAHPQLAALPGGFAAVWHGSTPSRVETRRFAADGVPAGEQARADTRSAFVTWNSNSVAAGADGRLVVVWATEFGLGDNQSDVWGRLFDGSGEPLGPEFRLNSTTAGRQNGAQVAAAADGSFVAVWLSSSGVEYDVRGRLFAADGTPLGPDFMLSSTAAGVQYQPRVAREESGGFAVAWLSIDPSAGIAVHVRRFDHHGAPLGPEVRVITAHAHLTLGGLAGDGRGTYVVSWSALDPDAGRFSVFARLLLPDCSGDGAHCLAGRFLAEVAWRTPDGSSGSGTPVPITADTGAFWFFSPANPELLVKVLDGRSLNGHFWVFLGGLTDVAFELRLTDTQTGARWTYLNPQGALPAHADTRAFAAEAADSVDAVAAGSLPLALPSHPPSACAPWADVLCLAGGAFTASVTLDDPRAGSAQPRAVPLSEDSGYFWFFDPSNVEVMIKVLDGRAVNGHFWVFYAALTDLELEILVTDASGHQGRTYRKPAGRLESRADTAAF